jgi:hypothetical protein
MKKYFLFDDEPISGNTYWLRVLFGSFLMLILVGFWTLAATGYKRAGTFGWKKEYRIIAAILIPILAIGNAMAKSGDYNNTPVNLFDIISLFAVVFHSVLLFKNGNKTNGVQLPTFNILDCKIEALEKLEVKLKYDNYSSLDFQIIGQLTSDFNRFNFRENTKISFQLFDINNKVIHGKYILLKTFDTSSYNPFIKDGIFKFEEKMKISKDQFSKISSCNLIEE